MNNVPKKTRRTVLPVLDVVALSAPFMRVSLIVNGLGRPCPPGLDTSSAYWALDRRRRTVSAGLTSLTVSTLNRHKEICLPTAPSSGRNGLLKNPSTPFVSAGGRLLRDSPISQSSRSLRSSSKNKKRSLQTNDVETDVSFEFVL